MACTHVQALSARQLWLFDTQSLSSVGKIQLHQSHRYSASQFHATDFCGGSNFAILGGLIRLIGPIYPRPVAMRLVDSYVGLFNSEVERILDKQAPL